MKSRLIAAALALALGACGQEVASQAPAPAAAAAASPAPATPTASSAAEEGEKLFVICGVCHTVAEGDRSLVGPNLWGVYGAEVGIADDFVYSDALLNSGIVWTDETLDAYIEAPLTYIPGNRMAYAGEPNPDKRAKLIEYMKTLAPAE